MNIYKFLKFFLLFFVVILIANYAVAIYFIGLDEFMKVWHNDLVRNLLTMAVPALICTTVYRRRQKIKQKEKLV